MVPEIVGNHFKYSEKHIASTHGNFFLLSLAFKLFAHKNVAFKTKQDILVFSFAHPTLAMVEYS